MQYDTDFQVRYRVDAPVPIHDVIESLKGVETVLRETVDFLPLVIEGLAVEHFEIKVRQIAQQSPLRELFVLTMFLAYQKSLEAVVVPTLEHATHADIPPNFEPIVTLTALIIVFYGAGAIKDFITGRAHGPTETTLNGLIKELSQTSGVSEETIKSRLMERFSKGQPWKRVTKAAARFFHVSKREDSAPIEVNERIFDREIIADVPAEYVFEDMKDVAPARSFSNINLELHAQDKDHSGQGWAAVLPGIVDRRIKVRLMPGVSAADLWGKDHVKGDVTVIYEGVGDTLVPRSVHLHALSG